MELYDFECFLLSFSNFLTFGESTNNKNRSLDTEIFQWNVLRCQCQLFWFELIFLNEVLTKGYHGITKSSQRKRLPRRQINFLSMKQFMCKVRFHVCEFIPICFREISFLFMSRFLVQIYILIEFYDTSRRQGRQEMEQGRKDFFRFFCRRQKGPIISKTRLGGRGWRAKLDLEGSPNFSSIPNAQCQ